MLIILPPGTCLTVGFSDEERNRIDGEFEIHHDTKDHPMALLIKETAGLPGSVKGGAEETLYEEYFGLSPDVLSKLPQPNGVYLAHFQRWSEAEPTANGASVLHGYSMICEAPPGLYHVFAGKPEVVQAAVDDFIQTFVASLADEPTPALETVAVFKNGERAEP